MAIASTFLSMFTHANIRTPRWLGFIVTRPESHALHHERGVHGRNYGDVPWFDMLFGTYDNPRRCEVEVGFYDGASSRIGHNLILERPHEVAPPLVRFLSAGQPERPRTAQR